jgi:hypothetical protein
MRSQPRSRVSRLKNRRDETPRSLVDAALGDAGGEAGGDDDSSVADVVTDASVI